MNKTQLKAAAGLSSSTISKMGKNEQASMDSMLNCDIGDIVEVKNEPIQQDKQSMDMQEVKFVFCSIVHKYFIR